MRYLRQTLPKDYEAGAIEREFERLEQAFKEFDGANFTLINAVPSKPREGDVRFADGTNWNPGSGKGLYIYYDGAWHKLIDPSFLEGTWTPTLTFATPGNLSVTYLAQEGLYERLGRRVTVIFRIRTTTFTHTTASGELRLEGLPFSPLQERSGTMLWSGITKAGFTEIVPRSVASSTFISFGASGSGVAAAPVAVADTPTGGTVRLEGQITYEV